MRSKKSIFGVLTVLPLMGVLSLTGYSGVLAETGNTEGNPMSAMVLKNKVQELQAEAAQFEAAASKISPYADTKGFRRGGLKAAAQEKRYEAKQMQDMYAAHSEKVH